MYKTKNQKSAQNYEQENYGKKAAFASFLPGIAGIHGIPLWCYYVNRGQGVVSFGVDNKDHAIMEYYPAHVAYQNVKRTGFRTFLRRDGQFFEPFEDENREHCMQIGMNELKIREEAADYGIRTEVSYTILPEEPVAALIRKVTITNTGESEAELEMLDGMPVLIPYGVNQDNMKNMTQTAKAWMQVENLELDSVSVSYFRVRASIQDSAEVTEVLGGNFGYGVSEEGEVLAAVTDPEAIFSYDLSLGRPVRFLEDGLAEVQGQVQNSSNLLPCCFFASSFGLKSGESRTFYELIGQVDSPELLREFFAAKKDEPFFEKKIRRAVDLTKNLTEKIATKTGNPTFDAYCRYTYMDNVLRGGEPIPLGHHRIFHVYSRKHGDLERDYNYFSMLPEYYSQGNGNFRDVNQNRRMDSFFSPYVERENIRTFYSLVQLDGYNPLGVERKTYVVSKEDADMILSECEPQVQEEICEVIMSPFTPGKLYKALARHADSKHAEQLFASLIDFAQETVNGNFGEGYWSDHWDYNLDLIEEYLSIYPDQEREMLYDNSYTYFLSQANLLPRARRYTLTDNGVRQYHSLNPETLRNTAEKLVRTDYGKGEVLYTTLAEKLILLGTVKFAALDPYGMGIEMEGGKPGWYDALNGLPGLIGSSMAETYELSRHLDYTIRALRRNSGKLMLLPEIAALLAKLSEICTEEKDTLSSEGMQMSFWNQINDAKESYREQTYEGIAGERKGYDSETIAQMLAELKGVVDLGIQKAVRQGNGLCPTYFYYEMTEYECAESEIHAKKFQIHTVPYFLEGPVRYLKLELSADEKKDLYLRVKNSDLYDEKLSMYKVNASLEKESYELGRATSFTPGWLENESIWLHMEYKYLLELLKSGLYKEYFEDFHKAAVPFLKEEIYGRSVLENSSFLASSKNPNPSTHGRGFVARLSGSTVEFLNIWKIMMFGMHPFRMAEETLRFVPQPAIPSYLLDDTCTVQAKLLGNVDVVYHFESREDYYPGNYEVTSMEILQTNGVRGKILGSEIVGRLAEDIRTGKVKQMEIYVKALPH